MKYLIYALVDPRTSEPRYIGKSSSGLNRPKQHYCPCHLKKKRHVSNWVEQLRSLNLKYQIVVLYESSVSEGLCEAEKFWIKDCKDRGFNLTNHTDGGDGWTVGMKHREDTKAKIRASCTGLKRSEATCRNIGYSKKGQDTSKATEAARIANTGRKMKDRGQEWRAKLSTVRTGTPSPQKGRKRTPEQVARFTEAQRKRRAKEKL